MKQKPLKNSSPEKEQRKQTKQPEGSATLSRYADPIGLAAILLLGILIYSNSFNCSFHFDDTFNIVNNTNIRDLSDVNAWWNISPNRPVAFFTFALNYHFNQLDVWGWHLVNLAIHLSNALLVWGLTLLIFSSPVMKDQPIARHKRTLALLTAFLFVSHPLATQSVTYIVQRMTSLAALFYLLSLVLYARARLSDTSPALKYGLFAGAFVSGVLALFTKENAFTLPFALLLLEFFFFRENKVTLNFRDRRIIWLLAVLLGGLLIMLQKFSFRLLDPIAPEIANDYRTITSLHYLLTQFSVIVKYIGLLILPVNQSFDYDFPLSNSLFEIRTLLSFCFLLSLFGLGVYLFNRNRIISFCIFWFFLTLSIESSIIPINDLIFEHRTYLPSFGFFLLLSTGLVQGLWDRYRTVAMAVFIGIIASNAFLSFQRNKVWKDEFTLLSDMILKSPEKARGYNNRGNIYSRDGKYELGLKDFNQAIKVQPNYVDAYYNRGNAYYRQNKYELALNDFNKAIELAPDHPQAYNNRGSVFYGAKKYEQAINDFNKAIELKPALSDAYINRGNVFYAEKKYEQAIQDFNKAIDLKPGAADAYYNRGNVYKSLEQSDQAIADYSKSIELDPKNYNAYDGRGNVYLKDKKIAEAMSDFNKLIELNPGDPKSYISRGVLFFEEKKYEDAVRDFSKAISLRSDFAPAYFNRSLAQYYLGKREAACQDMQHAAGVGYEPAKDALRQVCN